MVNPSSKVDITSAVQHPRPPFRKWVVKFFILTVEVLFDHIKISFCCLMRRIKVDLLKPGNRRRIIHPVTYMPNDPRYMSMHVKATFKVDLGGRIAWLQHRGLIDELYPSIKNKSCLG